MTASAVAVVNTSIEFGTNMLYFSQIFVPTLIIQDFILRSELCSCFPCGVLRSARRNESLTIANSIHLKSGLPILLFVLGRWYHLALPQVLTTEDEEWWVDESSFSSQIMRWSRLHGTVQVPSRKFDCSWWKECERRPSKLRLAFV